jgi:pimeloyl-ACP methyl ester carboxylesterase
MINRRFRAPIFGGIAATVLAAATYGAVSIFRGGVRARRFGYNIVPLSETEYVALATHGWRAVGLDVGDGLRVRGLELDRSDRAQPWILFYTGNEAHPLREGQRFIDEVRGDQAWGGDVWAYRGFDGSAGTPSAESLGADAWQQYQALLSRAAGSLHLVGFSLGTSIAAYVAARAKAAGSPPASVILLAPFTEIDMQLGNGWTRHRYETLKYLDGIGSPVLVVHGSQDDVLPIEGGRLVAARLGARFIEQAGLKHLDLALSPAVIHDVRSFIVQHQPVP